MLLTRLREQPFFRIDDALYLETLKLMSMSHVQKRRCMPLWIVRESGILLRAFRPGPSLFSPLYRDGRTFPVSGFLRARPIPRRAELTYWRTDRGRASGSRGAGGSTFPAPGPSATSRLR